MEAIKASESFARKGLGTHTINPVLGCIEDCGYCYVPSVYRFQLGKDKRIIHDDKLWLESLERQAFEMKAKMLVEKSYEPITFILSTACDPFSDDIAETSIKAIKILLEYFGLCSNVNIRIITKKLWNYIIEIDKIFNKHTDRVLESWKRRMIFNISLGDLRFNWWHKIEPNVDSPILRKETIRALQNAGYRTAIMACPIPPGQYEQTFECYEDVLEKAEEIFCEIINSRGDNIKRIAEYFPEVDVLKTKLGRSQEAVKLTETARKYVKDHSKLRVMVYHYGNFTKRDYDKMCEYNCVRWL